MIKKKFQIFADGEGGGAEGGDGAGTQQEPAESKTFDDFLKEGDYQAEFDRRVQKAINTAVANAERKWRALTDDKVSEAEKLAQMTAEQKEKYRADKAEKELADLKRQIMLSEMSGTARKMLADENIVIPDEIIANLVSDDAEKTKAAVESFAKTYKAAIQNSVKEALKGNTPKASGEPPTITKEEIMKIKDRAERQQMIAEHPELFIRR